MRFFAASFSLPLLLALCSGLEDQKLTFEIKTTWDGQPIDHDPARVGMFVTESGDLNLTMSAPFFNSPIPSETNI